MKLLNDVEKEFLKIILDSEHIDYNYKGADEKFPEYIYRQRKKLFSILEECGYIASYSVFVDGFWDATITPLGINYFEKEEEYRMMNERSTGNINISTLNANGCNINFGNVEGNTLTLRETQVFLGGITVGGKSLKEYLESH